jgi:hypothetical protein
MHQLIATAIAARNKTGMILRFEIPGREDTFTCYPKDDASKRKWLEQAAAKGWRPA